MAIHTKERRLPIVSAVSASRLYIGGAIVLSLITVASVLATVIIQPTLTVTVAPIIVGIMGPLITALLGAGGIGILKVIDGHQSQLMGAIAAAKEAEGMLKGLRENPQTNIGPAPETPAPGTTTTTTTEVTTTKTPDAP